MRFTSAPPPLCCIAPRIPFIQATRFLLSPQSLFLTPYRFFFHTLSRPPLSSSIELSPFRLWCIHRPLFHEMTTLSWRELIVPFLAQFCKYLLNAGIPDLPFISNFRLKTFAGPPQRSLSRSFKIMLTHRCLKLPLPPDIPITLYISRRPCQISFYHPAPFIDTHPL